MCHQHNLPLSLSVCVSFSALPPFSRIDSFLHLPRSQFWITQYFEPGRQRSLGLGGEARESDTQLWYVNIVCPWQTCKNGTHAVVQTDFRAVVVSWGRAGEKGMGSGISFESEIFRFFQKLKRHLKKIWQRDNVHYIWEVATLWCRVFRTLEIVHISRLK